MAAIGSSGIVSKGSLDPEVYLKKHHILTYIEDAVSFILERKDEDPKTKPFELLAEYFKSIKMGTHILFREYSFVCATPHNRISFVKVFWQSYSEIASRNELMKVAEYLTLLRLHCYDFPAAPIHKISQIMFTHNTTENLVSFPDFLYTFQTVFYYEYFLSLCGGICTDLLSGQTPHTLYGGSTVVVSMPSATEQDTVNRPPTSSSSLTSEGQETIRFKRNSSMFETDMGNKQLDSDSFVTAVISLVQKLQEKEPWECWPSVETVYETLQGVPSLTFFDFVMSLARSDAVNAEIGVLPPRGELVPAKSSTDKDT